MPPSSRGENVVFLAVRAEGEVSKAMMAWALTHVVRPGDIVTFLAILPDLNDTRGGWQRMLRGFPWFNSVTDARWRERRSPTALSCSACLISIEVVVTIMSNISESSVQASGAAVDSNMENLQHGSRLHWKQKWGPVGDECFVILLQEEQNEITGLPSSFKTEVWTRVWSAYVQKTKEDVSISQLKNRWKTLKKNYRIWDYVSHRPTPDSPEIWDDVLKVNKDYKIARERSFPLYWTLHALAGMSTAIGRYAMASTKDHPPVDITEGYDESNQADHNN
ncbi:hypothetical protein J5N97_024577 [Dioscorea zingiberensis]|uniref:Myb/SANT-like domain-containing protein n=1 Tax=Dioscorea zingiberensis TaxID=325984 RepID=A0A9D5C7L5_9LILI|nr:hypothetical protein J5N97_024577 [Dioscorea zingiberensis]